MNAVGTVPTGKSWRWHRRHHFGPVRSADERAAQSELRVRVHLI